MQTVLISHDIVLCIKVANPYYGVELPCISLNEFHFKLRPDLCINIEGEFECTAAEISLLPKYIYFLMHQKGNVFSYETVMTNLCNTNNAILVGTDQNFDYMKTDANANVVDLLNVFFTIYQRGQNFNYHF